MIRECVVGFDVFDDKGELAGHVASFSEASELYSKVKPKQTKRRRKVNRPSAAPWVLNSATSDTKVHISKSVGVPTRQVDRFNKELEKHGVTDARYSSRTGFLESTSEHHKNAALAIRDYSNFDGGQNAQMWANRLGH